VRRHFVDKQQVVHEIYGGLVDARDLLRVAVLREPPFPTRCGVMRFHHVRLMVEDHQRHDVARVRGIAGRVDDLVE